MTDKIMTTFKHVQSERLLLREPVEQDASALFTIHADPQTNQYNPNGPMQNFSQAIEMLNRWRQDWQNDGFSYWCVSELDHSNVIGFGGIRRMYWANRDVLNLYYRFSPQCWGRGIATEVALTAVRFGCEFLPGIPIVARISPLNLPSIKVAQRIGMEHSEALSNSEYKVFVTGG